MRRSPYVDLAHRSLKNYEKNYVDFIINSTNLTPVEKEIVTRSELEKERLEAISVSLKSWGKKWDCGYSNCAKIKRQAMIKIGEFIQRNLLSA